MDYEVILTNSAQAQLDHIIDYILSKLKNEQAALNVLKDAEDTRRRLSHTAGNLKLCNDPVLRSLGYRTIHFKKHRYFMLYRLENNNAYVDAIYHDMQDYENITI